MDVPDARRHIVGVRAERRHDPQVLGSTQDRGGSDQADEGGAR
jgi:hypothetical protein